MLSLRSAAGLLSRRMASTVQAAARRNMSEMSFTFAAPNGVLYNATSVKQVRERKRERERDA